MRKLTKKIKQEAEEVSKASILLAKKFVSFVINVRLLKFRNPFILLKSFLIILFLAVNVSGSTSNMNSSEVGAMGSKINPQELYIENMRTNFKIKLEQEVEKYINKMAPTSGLEGSYVVEKCLEYKTDIVFVLAQGLLESHYGTRGVAKKTNSVWNVGAYDNQKPRNWYDSPDESLEPYLKLLKEDYLINITHAGDTIQKDVSELVMDDYQYTNYAGKRFASARGYENAMRKLMVRIDMETSIRFYQEILSLSDGEMIVYFVPQEEGFNLESFQAANF
jgi:hypothetical protein